MNITGNTILVTGGGSGIGRALAEAFHAEGNTVIIAGRRKALLDAVVAANPGMASAVLDIDSSAAIASFAETMRREWPGLDVVIHNAGIMRAEAMRPDPLRKDGVADAEAMVTTNLLGPIRLNAALLPLLERQARATIITVSSGLAFVPLASTPTYSATKAALHSYTQSLRYQLRETAIAVKELIPPYVQTELMGPAQASDPRAMPLADFIREVMEIIRTTPEATEICVEKVAMLRNAEANGNYGAFFTQFNDALADLH